MSGFILFYLSDCYTVHFTPAVRDDAAGVAREGPFSIFGPADLAEADGAGHQHAAAGYSASAGHPVTAARFYQVS